MGRKNVTRLRLCTQVTLAALPPSGGGAVASRPVHVNRRTTQRL